MRTLLLTGLTAFAAITMPASLIAQEANAPAVPKTANQANAETSEPRSTTTILPGKTPSQPDTIIEDNRGNLTPPPITALDKTYPVCTAQLQDSCRNPGEGGGEERGG